MKPNLMLTTISINLKLRRMKRLLIKVYDWLGIGTNDWNLMQMMFGKHYLGAILLAILIALYACYQQLV